MATLAGNTIASSYKDLLKIAEASKQSGIDGTLRAVEDGDATASALYLATDSVLVKGDGVKLYFYDADGGEHISADASGNLTIGAGVDLNLTATTDINIPVNVGLRFGDGGENIETDNTNLTITSGADIILATGGSVYGAGKAGTSNTVYGKSAGASLDAGSNYNVFVGEGVSDASMDDAINNVGVGYQSLSALIQGDDNTAVGYRSLLDLEDGDYNVGIGSSAGRSITDGENNVAIGYQALDANLTGNINTAIGVSALGAFIGDACVAVGREALRDLNHASEANGTVGIGQGAGASLTNGQWNTAIGYQALATTTFGDKNVAVGYQAGKAYIPDENYGNSVFIGHQAGLNVTTARKATVIGNAAVGLGVMTGTSNIVIGNEAGYDLTGGSLNVIIGVEAGANTTGGSSNVYIGAGAADVIVSGDGNVVVGKDAFGGVAGSDCNHNIAIGLDAMLGNSSSTGDGNIGIGRGTMSAFTTAGDNVVIGYNAGVAMTVAGQNVYIGKDAAEASTEGDYNTVVGHAAFKAANGNDSNHNTVIGFEAGKTLTDGHSNTLIGSVAGLSISGGDGNAALGFKAADDLTSGSNCIFIGRDSNPGTGSHNKQIGIGYLVETSAAEQLRIGDSTNYLTYDYSGGGAGVAITSDERTKKDIVDTDLGLEFIKELRPIKYRMKATKDWPRNFLSKKITDAELDKEPKDTVWDGFLAQEVKAAADKLGLNYSGWTEDAGMGGRQELDYAKFVVPLVKAVQELSAKVKALEDA